MPRKRRTQLDPTLAVAYMRQSKDESRQRNSIQVQRHAIQRFADHQGLIVVAWFEDSGVSGGLDLEQRNGLQNAVEALSDMGAGVLLVWKRDRLARDLMTAVMVDRMAENVGARVYTTDGDNGDDENAVLLRGIKDLLAQHERLLIRSRTKAALALKRAKGERVGTVPYGFRLAADGVHLERCPEEQRVIALVGAQKLPVHLGSLTTDCQSRGDRGSTKGA